MLFPRKFSFILLLTAGLTAVFLFAAAAQTQTRLYMPLIVVDPLPTQTPTPQPDPLPPPETLSGTPPINWSAVASELHGRDRALAHNKIGLHTGIGGNATGIGEWMRTADEQGVPLFLKSVDNAGPLYELQELRKESGVPHVLVFRRSGLGFDLPDYSRPPREAAEIHWERHKSVFPPELDKNLVWIETVNEVDKNRSEWLAEFALATAEMALRDGYRWAAFGWSAGEPEIAHWESPQMLAFLRLVAQHPDRLAIALHEYSYTTADIGNWYPYLIGRFQLLFEVCDAHQIARPTVLITEWGWEYQDVPVPEQALADVRWAAHLYAAYPQVKGAGLWYLGGNFGGIAEQAQRLIAPLDAYGRSHYFAYARGQGRIDPSLFAPADRPAYLLRREPAEFRTFIDGREPRR